MNKALEIVNFFQKNKIFVLFLFIILTSITELLLFTLLQPLLLYLSDISSTINFPYLDFLIGEKNVDLKIFLLIFFLIFILRASMAIMVSYKKHSLIEELHNLISSKIFSKYLSKDFQFYISNNSSSLTANIIFEVNKFCYYVIDAIIAIVAEGFLIIAIFIYLVSVYLEASIMLIASISLFFFIFNKYYKMNSTKMGQLKTIHDNKRLEDLQRSFYIIQNIKLDKLENFFSKRFKHNTEISSRSFFKLQFMGEIAKPIIEFASLIIISIVIFLFYIYFEASKEQIFLMMSLFFISLFRILPSCNKVFHNYNALKFHQASIGIIHSEIFNKKSTNKNFEFNRKSINEAINFNKSISLKDVSFSYDDSQKHILSDVNITIEKDKTIGIYGASGSGKTTLLNLICHLLKPTSGQLLIDENSVEINPESYQKKIGYVSQRVYLMDDSIINNVILGQEMDKFDYTLFNDVMKKADLDNMIKNFPDGENTLIGERGIKLSGGQQQKLGIARALYKKPEILILDEATNALDNYSELEVFKTLTALKNKITIIIVSHKKSLIEFCDIKFKVDKGKVSKDI